MAEKKPAKTKRLVGNDIVVGKRSALPPKPQPKPRPIQPDIRPPQRKLKSVTKPQVKTTVPADTPKKPIIDQAVSPHSHRALINVLAWDLLVVVALGYVAFESSLLVWAIAVYAVLALVFHIWSRRLYLSAAVCIILVPVLWLLHHNSLEKSYLAYAAFFLVMGTVCLALELLKAPYFKRKA